MVESSIYEYDKKFFERLKDDSFRSAMKIIPLVQELIPIKSVVDVGCGTGSWLKAFQKNGVRTIYGVDGNQTGLLEIPRNRFFRTDLRRPFKLKEKFDLAVSVEVAEHLPKKSADSFVKNLTDLAPAVLFSAAIPGQGGDHHINEQWPEYWASKFNRRGFVALDCIRTKIWKDREICWWYRQNLILYVRKSLMLENPKLSGIPIADPPQRFIYPRVNPHSRLRRVWKLFRQKFRTFFTV